MTGVFYGLVYIRISPRLENVVVNKFIDYTKIGGTEDSEEGYICKQILINWGNVPGTAD